MGQLKTSIGVAFVGSGFAANFHAENYKRVNGIDIRFVGVHSRRYSNAREFASSQGVERVYQSLDELLNDSDVSVVDACVPTALHEEIVIRSLEAGKHVVVEKPFTGSFIPGKSIESREKGLKDALSSADRMIEAEEVSDCRIMYAENWVYAPGVQKAKRLLESANSPILRIVAEESHSGTHSAYAMQWVTSGGGSLLNKGCHPLGGALYLKHAEGLRRLGKPIRPHWVIGAVANLTHSEAFNSEKEHFIRTGWTDCEDWGVMIVGFDDGTVAQISASDITLGGVQNIMTVYGGQSVINVNINPNDAVLAYSPNPATFTNEYIREKVETTAGWQFTNPDEDWMNGFPHEMQDFSEVIASGKEPISNSMLGRDVVAVCYSAYLSAAKG